MSRPSLDEIKKREKILREKFGLTPEVIERLRRHSKSLCDPDLAEIRMKNLKSLGFAQWEELIRRNPEILNRTEEHVTKRFYLVQMWMSNFDHRVNVHSLFLSRSQLWSVGHKKLLAILHLALNGIKNDVTPERLCNLITLNIDVLLATFVQNPTLSCTELFNQSRVRAESVRKLSKKVRQKFLRGIVEKSIDILPGGVQNYY